LTVNGVTFQNSSDLPNFSNTGFNAGYGSFPNPGTADNNYNTLLQSGAYEYPGPVCTFSWGGMTPGHTYLLELWVNGNDASRTETLTGGANTSASLNYEPGQYIIGTFVANNTGAETVTLNGAPADNLPQVNLVQVRDLTVSTATGYQNVVLADKPLGYWPLNLAVDTGNTATDVSGNGNNGTYYNVSSANDLVAGPSPYIPNAASFNNAEVDLSSAGNASLLDFSGPTTLEAWVQPADSTSFGDVIAKGYDSGNYQEIVLRENGGYGANFYGALGSGGVSGGQQNTNWDYLVLANDGTYDYLYINGALVQKSADARGSVVFSDFITWAIGNGSSGGDGRTFNGNICQVAIYNYGLTAPQVLNHYYAAELNAPPATSVPIISSQPQSQAGFVNGSITFTVSAVSASATTNQWYKNGNAISGQTNASLTLNNLQLTDAANYTVVVGNVNGTTRSAVAALTVATGNTLRWNDGGTSGVWDTGVTPNWLNLGNSTQTVFNSGDAVLFDDTPGVSTSININSSVSPSVVTVNSSTNAYTINNTSFPLTGSAAFVKQGSSALTIINAANFTGPATIAGGSVYAGNNCFKDVSSITVANGGTLDFGGGTYNTGQPVTLSGNGVTNEGALYNSYNDDPGEIFSITLAGDTTFGGSARWDFVGGSVTGPHNITILSPGGYGEWNSVTLNHSVGNINLYSGSFGIKNMGSTFGNPAANFIANTNTVLDFWSGDSGYARNYHILNGAKFQFVSGIQYFGGNATFEDGSQFTIYGGGGNQTIGGSIVLNGNVHFVFGDANSYITNPITGSGGFVWDAYNHLIVFTAANTYTGPTVIGGGLTLALANLGSISHSTNIFFGGGSPANVSLDVSGRTDGTLTLASGQTLGGIGTVNGKLVVQAGAAIAPGGTNTLLNITAGSSVTGILSASNDITLGGNTIMKLNGSGVSDEIVSATKINYGGTLTVANVSGSPLAAGNSFQLFSAPALSGTFTIIPTTPGPGLAWDISQLASSGSLNVVAGSSGPVISTVQYASGQLVFAGTGGTPNANYVVYANTNLATATWVPVSTNAFDGSGDFKLTNAVSAGTPQQFYRIKE
jgi:hypothetical protein